MFGEDDITIFTQYGWHGLLITFVVLFLQNWFAFSKLYKPLFTEHGVISFPNTNPPLDKMNNAYCEVRIELLNHTFSSHSSSQVECCSQHSKKTSFTNILLNIFKTVVVICSKDRGKSLIKGREKSRFWHRKKCFKCI